MRTIYRVAIPLCVVLGLLATCTSAGATVRRPAMTTMTGQRHSPQGVSLQGTALGAASPEWLRGPRLVATLADGTPVEIQHFAGDAIHAAEVDEAGDAIKARVLAPGELVGMRWQEIRCMSELDDACTALVFRIREALPDGSQDALHALDGRDQDWLYRVDYTPAALAAMDDWTAACTGDSGGDAGLFVDGQWDQDGAWHGDGYTFSCVRGVIAKCAREWGYRPWQSRRSATGEMIDLQPLHIACARAARAEYCGDGVSYTRDGVDIDLFDIHGFNAPEPEPGYTLESSWDEAGAITVHHPRIPSLFRGSCELSATGQAPTAPGSRTPLLHVSSPPIER